MTFPPDGPVSDDIVPPIAAEPSGAAAPIEETGAAPDTTEPEAEPTWQQPSSTAEQRPTDAAADQGTEFKTAYATDLPKLRKVVDAYYYDDNASAGWSETYADSFARMKPTEHCSKDSYPTYTPIS